jgi:hypothetical protein
MTVTDNVILPVSRLFFTKITGVAVVTSSLKSTPAIALAPVLRHNTGLTTVGVLLANSE